MGKLKTKEKLEMIRKDLETEDFTDMYNLILKENRGADIYDSLGLEFGIDHCLSKQTKSKLETISEDDLKRLYQNGEIRRKMVGNALNFLE